MAGRIRRDVIDEHELVVGSMYEVQLAPGLEAIVSQLQTGEIVAFAALCPHQGARLIDGELAGTELICPAHRWRFDVASGLGIFPRASRLKTFGTDVVDGRVYVLWEGDTSTRV